MINNKILLQKQIIITFIHHFTDENRITRRNTCPSAALCTTKPTQTDLGANPGLRGTPARLPSKTFSDTFLGLFISYTNLLLQIEIRCCRGNRFACTTVHGQSSPISLLIISRNGSKPIYIS